MAEARPAQLVLNPDNHDSQAREAIKKRAEHRRLAYFHRQNYNEIVARSGADPDKTEDEQHRSLFFTLQALKDYDLKEKELKDALDASERKIDPGTLLVYGLVALSKGKEDLGFKLLEKSAHREKDSNIPRYEYVLFQMHSEREREPKGKERREEIRAIAEATKTKLARG